MATMATVAAVALSGVVCVSLMVRVGDLGHAVDYTPWGYIIVWSLR